MFNKHAYYAYRNFVEITQMNTFMPTIYTSFIYQHCHSSSCCDNLYRRKLRSTQSAAYRLSSRSGIFLICFDTNNNIYTQFRFR